MILSTIWYVSILYNFNLKTLKTWQNMINKYIIFGYNSKTNSTIGIIAESWIYLPKERGGLGLPNIIRTIQKKVV